MTGLRTIGWMARKELLRFAADRVGAALTLVVPTVLALLMSSLFAPKGLVDPLPLLVAAEAPGPRVERLLARLDANPGLRVIRISTSEAQERLQRGDASAVLVVPADAERVLGPLALFTGDRVETTLFVDPSRGTEVDLLEGLLARETMAEVSAELASADGRRELFEQIGGLAAVAPGLDPFARAKLGAFAVAGVELFRDARLPESRAMDVPLALRRTSIEVFNPKAEWNPYAHYFAGMLTMSTLFLAATASLNLLQERDEGALVRVRLTGADPVLALLGVGLGTSIVAVWTGVMVFAVGWLAFDLPIGSPVGLLAMLVALAALVGGFSLALAATARTARQASILGPFAILVMGFLGGSAVPSFIMPEWVQAVALGLPTTWSNEGLAAATWRGGSTLECLEWAAGLLGFAALFAGFGARAFRWS